MKNQIKSIFAISLLILAAGCSGITESTLPVTSEPVSTEIEMIDTDRGDIFNTGTNEEIVTGETKSSYEDRE